MGLSFGIDTFGKSAPYKEIYKHFGLTSANIASKLKKILERKYDYKCWYQWNGKNWSNGY